STNQTLLLTWPIATYCFLKSFRTRASAWSAAAGASAALAMLGKYYSVYLLAGFIAAVLFHPARWTYLRSPAPYVSVIAGLVVLSPHLYWLAANGAPSFMYASLHETTSTMEAVRQALNYGIGGLAYTSILLVAYALVARPNRKMIMAALWPEDADRRM